MKFNYIWRIIVVVVAGSINEGVLFSFLYFFKIIINVMKLFFILLNIAGGARRRENDWTVLKGSAQKKKTHAHTTEKVIWGKNNNIIIIKFIYEYMYLHKQQYINKIKMLIKNHHSIKQIYACIFMYGNFVPLNCLKRWASLAFLNNKTNLKK